MRKLIDLGNEANGSGVAQPAAAWIVGGDMNLSHSQLVSLCSWFVKPSKPCFSKSGMPPTRDAHKSDIAISQGIALVHVQALVGDHFRPCVSDAHDMVLIAGALGGMALPHPPPGNQGQKRSYRDALVRVPTPSTSTSTSGAFAPSNEER